MAPDSNSEESNPDFSEFLDAYFSECDEHLSAARSGLLELEPSIRGPQRNTRALDELFRSFHSIKGLSAMVGFHNAEQLAHHLESYLGAVRKQKVSLDLTGFECLMAGVVALEQAIAARRDKLPLIDVSSVVNQIATLLPRDPAAHETARVSPPAVTVTATESIDEHITEKTRDGAKAWRLRFSPSAELVERGIDVNSVRARIQAAGELVHSAPRIGSDGAISFEFLVISRATEEDMLAFNGPGLVCIPENQDKPALPAPEKILAPTTSGPTFGASTHLMPANIVRVDLERLDDLMQLVGELVMSRARLNEGLAKLKSSVPPSELRPLRETSALIERQLRDLREGVMRVRMVPVREVFARMQFVVRDLMREVGKQIEVRLSGEDTQIDKYVVERIMDPLLHLVRNAVSHGLESPDERIAAGKPPRGHIDLRAIATGETVTIEVEDDGRGIDIEQVMAKARDVNVLLHTSGDAASSILDVLCTPGFSTRDEADRVSGRGVGMDVVRQAVESLGGSLSLQTTVGHNTRFAIRLPLTLAIADALIVEVDRQKYAIPQATVREIVRVEPGSPTVLENNELLRYRGGVLPLSRLSSVFATGPTNPNAVYALVVGESLQTVGLVVDRVIGLREIVVRPLTDQLAQSPGIAGATELGDGRVVLILDSASLSRAARQRGRNAVEVIASTGTQSLREVSK